jgi:hypothetical protein
MVEALVVEEGASMVGFSLGGQRTFMDGWWGYEGGGYGYRNRGCILKKLGWAKKISRDDVREKDG